MTEETQVRLAMLRFLEERTSGLLAQVVASESALDGDTNALLQEAVADHDRHAKTLSGILRDVGEQGLGVPPSFAQAVEDRIGRVDASRTAQDVVDGLAALEFFAVEQYHRALAAAPGQWHESLNAQLLDEQRHAQVLGAKAERP